MFRQSALLTARLAICPSDRRDLWTDQISVEDTSLSQHRERVRQAGTIPSHLC